MKDYGKNVDNQMSLPYYGANQTMLDTTKKQFDSQNIDNERSEEFKKPGKLN